MKLHYEVTQKLRRAFTGMNLVIIDKGNDIEIVFRDSLDLLQLKRIDSILNENLNAIVFARDTRIVVRIEQAIEYLKPIVKDAPKEEIPIIEPEPIIEEIIEAVLEAGACAFCEGTGKIIDLLSCCKCKGTGIEIPEEEYNDDDTWDWEEPQGKEIQYFVMGIELDLNLLSL